MNSLVTLTDAAMTHIKQMLEKSSHGIGFRLSIKKTGCSGFAYVPNIINEIPQNDIQIIQDGLSIYVDPEWEKFVKGLVIDYVEDSRSGLKQKQLVYLNPNEKNRCGCGESFTIE